MYRKMLASLTLGVLLASCAAGKNFAETATCKLTNTSKNAVLYEGKCRVKQSMSGKNTIFSVKMGDAEPFLFAGRRGQENWMHGAEDVVFTDLPNGGIFRWSTFALAIAE